MNADSIVTNLPGMLQNFGIGAGLRANLLTTAAVLVALLVLRVVAQKLIDRHVDNVRAHYTWTKVAHYAVTGLAVVLVGRIWLEGDQSLATFFGLLSAGLAVALKDLIVGVAGWLFIMWRRPFVLGDRVQVGTISGDVVDQSVFQFTILEVGNWVAADQSTGRVVHIPNGQVFNQPVFNYTQGIPYIWEEIVVSITFESNWRKAKEILKEIATRHGPKLSQPEEADLLRRPGRFAIQYSTLQPTVYTSVGENGVILTIRCVVPPRQRRAIAEAMWEDILTAFDEHDDIAFAYMTRRTFDNTKEGKPGTRGKWAKVDVE